MENELHNLDLIDSLSERHVQLRKIAEKLWNDSSDIYLSNSEWFIIARTYKKQPTISEISKNVDISRQATHKFIKQLEAKGIVEINNVKNNKKHKCVRLTRLGEDCYEKNEALKATIEEKVSDQIGADNVRALKDMLKMNWGL
ncbi:winged helix-turn-helix transcriptional regulator [Oceanobacillus senegalensis]|uniref:winged helix-turn-helix transcriptional regulator n=1 Tax=Oceanobacillus senegalensis TaxID=1936063 RepID=UPI000A30B21D|nr:winged helix-turn-helix transcriptional regulator [Oceanobacillus senegalensis]